MNTISKNVFMLTLSFQLFCFLFVFLTPTYAYSKLEFSEKPNLAPNSAPAYAPYNPNFELTKKRKPITISPYAQIDPLLESKTKAPPKPSPKSRKANPKSPNTKPTQESNPKSPNAKSNSTSPKAGTNSTSPYHFANNFCLSRKLDVKTTFCLQVLRSNPKSTNAGNNHELLHISGEAAIHFGNKTLTLLEKMSEDNKTNPNLKQVIKECLSAYKGFNKQYKVFVQEAKINAQVASYDAELAKLEIDRCVKAVTKSWDEDIQEQNVIALDYTKLSQNIAVSIAP